MTTKAIEKELNGSNFINDYDIEIEDSKNTFHVELNIQPPHDTPDMTEILNLKKKIRSVVNSSYRIKFIVHFMV